MLIVGFSYAIPKHHRYHNHHSTGSCTLEIEDLVFGSYNPFDLSVKRNFSYLKVKCSGTGSVSFIIKFIGGNSSNYTNRYLFSPSTNGKLKYNIYYNNCPVGDGTNGTCTIAGTVNIDSSGISEKVFSLTGVMPPHQNVPAANDYYDIIQVFLEY
ncbi:spore coat protein U domain-containing protein [Persephonella sp.]